LPRAQLHEEIVTPLPKRNGVDFVSDEQNGHELTRPVQMNRGVQRSV
jgi:hypothetical protein